MTETRLYDDSGHDFDALLVVSFGGPEGPDDVMPFLENVFRGLRVTEETKERIAQRYYDFGGVSPINAHTRKFIAALEQELADSGMQLPVYWGNRNWHPLLPDTIGQMAADGIRNAAVYVTSTFSSYSGCRKYREDLLVACEGVDDAPKLDKLRVGFNHPGFIEAMTDRVRAAFDIVDSDRRRDARVLFTAHSLPESMAASSPYVEQLQDACTSIMRALDWDNWALVYQSNNARYGGEPWLGPDIGDALEREAEGGTTDVIVAPVGFVCDHMEVVLDLDVDARARAYEAGLNMIRAETVGAHPAYVRMVRELLQERAAGSGLHSGSRATIGALPAKHDFCPADCCLSGRPGPPKSSLCGSSTSAYSSEAR